MVSLFSPLRRCPFIGRLFITSLRSPPRRAVRIGTNAAPCPLFPLRIQRQLSFFHPYPKIGTRQVPPFRRLVQELSFIFLLPARVTSLVNLRWAITVGLNTLSSSLCGVSFFLLPPSGSCASEHRPSLQAVTREVAFA